MSNSFFPTASNGAKAPSEIHPDAAGDSTLEHTALATLERANGNGSTASEVSIDSAEESEIRILFAESDPALRDSCRMVLELDGYDVTVCERGEEALSLLRRRLFDIVLLDIPESDEEGHQLLQACLDSNPEALVIALTGGASVESSLELLRLGARECLPKPFSAVHLRLLLRRVAASVRALRATRETEAEVAREYGNSTKLTALGVSCGFRNALELARTVASTDAPVLISGESGTGKELIALFIHAHSRRHRAPLVTVNCAALVEGLLESELFGHCKGAFTGAVKDKAGLLEVADGGTFFLDEVAEMSPSVQAKLLRVLQDGQVRRVGSTTTDATVDVRFIAATNRDPEDAVERGILRPDLYYRLRVVPIWIPPLRERPEDIPILARHFLATFWRRHRNPGAPLPRLTEEALESLKSRAWPGNVRELQNVIEHAVVVLKPDVEVRPEDLPVHQTPPPGLLPGEYMDDRYHSARDRLVADFERRYLRRLVDRADGNMSEAARIAGVDRTTLYRLMEKHDLKRNGVSDLRAG